MTTKEIIDLPCGYHQIELRGIPVYLYIFLAYKTDIKVRIIKTQMGRSQATDLGLNPDFGKISVNTIILGVNVSAKIEETDLIYISPVNEDGQ